MTETTTKKETKKKEITFEDRLKAEIDEQDEGRNFIILKKQEYRGKRTKSSKPIEVPFVVFLENAGTTPDAISRYIRKGWPVVYSNFTDLPTTRGADGRPKRDERVEGVKAFINSLSVQSTATIETPGTRAKYEERLRDGK